MISSATSVLAEDWDVRWDPLKSVGTPACQLPMCPGLPYNKVVGSKRPAAQEEGRLTLCSIGQSSPFSLKFKAKGNSLQLSGEWQGSERRGRTANIAVAVFKKYNVTLSDIQISMVITYLMYYKKKLGRKLGCFLFFVFFIFFLLTLCQYSSTSKSWQNYILK